MCVMTNGDLGHKVIPQWRKAKEAIRKYDLTDRYDGSFMKQRQFRMRGYWLLGNWTGHWG